MRITSFHIDNFGIFSDVAVENLKPGLSIFYGPNEAGKSTCMEFLRCALTGFPARSKKHPNNYAIQGSPLGGSLTLDCERLMPENREIWLLRRQGKPVQLVNKKGDALSEDLLKVILGGVSADVYRNVFGFSLSELENLASLSEKDIQNALYGASFGANLKSPAEIIKKLEKSKDDLFKARGVQPELNQALQELDGLKSSIYEAMQNNASFDKVSNELAQKRRELDELTARKQAAEQEFRILERRTANWRHWENLRLLQDGLARLGSPRAGFPEDALNRLEKLETTRDMNEELAAAKKDKLSRLKSARDSLAVDQGLLTNRVKFNQLATDYKAAYSAALANLPMHRDARARAEQELADLLSQLGPGWTCDRIKATDRSLFAREGMEKTAREHDQSEMEYQAARTAMKQANSDVAASEEFIAETEKKLADLPVPEAILNDEERDNLRRMTARLQEDERLVPNRERAVDAAKNSFRRLLSQINLNQPETGSQGIEALLDTILRNQDDALNMAKKMQEHIQERSEIAVRVKNAAEERDNIKRKQDESLERLAATQGPGRSVLESRARALKSLRGILASMETEKTKISELDLTIGNAVRPSRTKNLALSILGIFFIIVSIFVFGAHWLFHLTEISLGEFNFPVNLYVGYVAFAFGVISLAGGMPGKNPELTRYKKEMNQMRERRQQLEKTLAELEKQAAQLCAEANVESMDPIVLETREALLERDREQCFHDERNQKEIEDLKREYMDARRQVEKLQEEQHKKDSEIQQGRQRWHHLMESLHLSSVPLPENAPSFFMRAEQARAAYDLVFTSGKELEELREDIETLKTSIAEVEPVARLLAEAGEPLQETVNNVLALCREADLARDKRIGMEASLEAAKSENERALKKQEEASRRLEIAKKMTDSALEKWASLLDDYGLEKNLDPQTVRNAFELMDSCLKANEKLAAAKGRIEQDKQALEALRQPLASLLGSLDKSPLPGGDGEPDWALTLDTLIGDADKNYERQLERERIEKQIAEEEMELGSIEATLGVARSRLASLFSQAGVEGRDEFIQACDKEREIKELGREIDTLTSTLAIAAGEEPLEEFLKSFESEDPDSLEAKLEALGKSIEELGGQERAAAQSVGSLDATVKSLTTDETVSRLRQEEMAALDNIQDKARTWLIYAMAQALIEKAKKNYEQERQPEVIREASRLFSKITGGEWSGINASLESSNLVMLKKNGERLAPEFLSKGTQEQAYLALRLAYIANHAAHATALPVLMDEILVNFDRKRAERAASVFHNLENGQQIFYFTCHKHVMEMLVETSANIPVYQLADKKISLM